ncbi:hypothetical protein GCM10008992_31720 [Halorubrum aquaticum]
MDPDSLREPDAATQRALNQRCGREITTVSYRCLQMVTDCRRLTSRQRLDEMHLEGFPCCRTSVRDLVSSHCGPRNETRE